MKHFITQFTGTILGFLIMDSIWFALFMKKFAIEKLRAHMNVINGNIQTSYPAAALTYVLMAFLAVIFLSPKLTSNSSLLYCLVTGFSMGIAVFGVFDLTNYAIMKSYPLSFVIVDTLWGGLIFSIAALFLWKTNI